MATKLKKNRMVGLSAMANQIEQAMEDESKALELAAVNDALKEMQLPQISEQTTTEKVDVAIEPEMNKELSEKKIIKVPISKVYSAPPQWNEWNKWDAAKIVENVESFIQIGQQNACIMWKIDREKVAHLYPDDFVDQYGFIGTEFMVIAGHNRTYTSKLISESEYERASEYESVDTVVYEDEYSEDFIQKVKQIIDDTNYLSRIPSPKEIMKAIKRKYKEYDSDGRRSKSGKVATQVADSLNLTERTVFRYTKLNYELIEPLLDMMYNQEISMNVALKLTELEKPIQEKLYEQYQPELRNKKHMTTFIKSISKDMNWDEIETKIKIPETKIKYESVTVTVPAEYVKQFYKMFKEWKANAVKELEGDTLHLGDTVEEE